MASIECYFNEDYAAMATGETQIGSAEGLVHRNFSQHVASTE